MAYSTSKMDKKLYSIGEAADIMGISVKLLRHYCNIGIIEPEYVDPDTGYRYFSYEQFPLIDRTRYLLKCGLSLQNIKSILSMNDIDILIEYLDKKKADTLANIDELLEISDNIDWYKEYFTSENRNVDIESLYNIKQIEDRYAVVVPCHNDSYEEFHIRLHRVKNSKSLRHLDYTRQFFDVINYDDLLKGIYTQTHLGMYLKNAPDCEIKNIIKIPAGTYFCFKARIKSDGWNPYPIKWFFSDKDKPRIVLANEFENDFVEFSRCVFEVQILLTDDDIF